jgi:type III secretion YscU/HrpY family protein
MGEKTEKATPKKMTDARKKGQIAKSQDFPSAATFMVSMMAMINIASWWFESFSSFLVTMMNSIKEDNLTDLITFYFGEALSIILNASLPILGLVVITGVLVSFLIQGPVFSVEVFKPDPKKFDPIKNLKAKFKLKTFVELLKSIAKITGAAILIYFIWKGMVPAIVQATDKEPIVWLVIMAAFIKDVVLQVGIFFVAVAVLDLSYQKKAFAKEMMMEKFEIKQEYKNSEGDPQIKGKRKEIAREIAYSDGPAAGVKQASAVVTNPAHIAVAIAYEVDIDPAPIIVSMGQHYVARLIIKEAEKHKKPIIRNIELAHHLFEEGKLYEYIPESTYEAMAEILKWLASLNEGYTGDKL